MRVYTQLGCAEPETLVEALIRRAPAVRNVEIVHMMTMGVALYVAPEMAGHFRVLSAIREDRSWPGLTRSLEPLEGSQDQPKGLWCSDSRHRLVRHLFSSGHDPRQLSPLAGSSLPAR